MNETRTLPLQVHLIEKEAVTQADVTLTMQSGQVVRGHGEARRNPRDRDVPEIGDELAVARALSELSHRLVETAAAAIGGIEQHPVHLTH